MKRLGYTDQLDDYLIKYNINDIFSVNMRPYMSLYFCSKNDFIIEEGDKMDHLYFFVDGKAKVFTSLSNGKSLLLSFYEGFRVLGDVEIMNKMVASCSVQAIMDSYCIGIDIDHIRQYGFSDAKFLQYICSTLALKLDRASKNSSINLLYPLENRLASYIIATYETKDSNEMIADFNGNLTEISELLGSSYRHLLRTLSNLCEKKVLAKKEGYYEIVNKKELKALAADLYK